MRAAAFVSETSFSVFRSETHKMQVMLEFGCATASVARLLLCTAWAEGTGGMASVDDEEQCALCLRLQQFVIRHQCWDIIPPSALGCHIAISFGLSYHRGDTADEKRSTTHFIRKTMHDTGHPFQQAT